MLQLSIIRCQQNEEAAKGVLLVNGVMRFLTLELPWMRNLKTKSCIPAGTYRVSKRRSSRFERDLYEVLSVPGRSGIFFHAGNKTSDTAGCILLGLSLTTEGKEIFESKRAIDVFHELLEGQENIELRIV